MIAEDERALTDLVNADPGFGSRRRWYNNPHTRWYLARVGPTAVGFLAVEDGLVVSVYVRPEHRRRGVASALLNAAEAVSPIGDILWPTPDGAAWYVRAVGQHDHPVPPLD